MNCMEQVEESLMDFQWFAVAEDGSMVNGSIQPPVTASIKEDAGLKTKPLL